MERAIPIDQGKTMDWKRIKNFGLKRSITAGVLCVGLIVAGRMAIETNRELQRQTHLSDGLQTCFSRVHQSFTARMIGDSSNAYLGRSFMDTTSRCFGEAIHLAEKSFSKSVPEYARMINNLATEVHIFHDRVNGRAGSALSNNNREVDISEVGTRFEKLEQLRNEILGLMEQRSSRIQDTLSTVRGAFYVLAMCLVIFFAFEISYLRKEAKIKAEIEAEAQGLIDEQDMSALRVQEVIRRALEQEEYNACGQLFNQFHHYQTKVKNDVVFQEPAREQFNVETQANVSREAEIERVWVESDSPESRLVVYDEMFRPPEQQAALEETAQVVEERVGIELSQSIENVVELMAAQSRARGVKIDLHLDEEIRVKGEAEGVEYLLYQACEFITSNTSENSEAQLNIQTRRLGNVAITEIEFFGEGFAQELVQSQLGFKMLDDSSLPLEWRLCQDLSRECEAKISFDNQYDDGGAPAGRSVKITFKQGERVSHRGESSVRVKALETGTKREILDRIKTAAF
jgi:hypothetical protein